MQIKCHGTGGKHDRGEHHPGVDNSSHNGNLLWEKQSRSQPTGLSRTLKWDQGSEMAGLRRQYLPKGTDLSKHSAQDLQAIQRSLNGRIRKTLGYMMPQKKLIELVALPT